MCSTTMDMTPLHLPPECYRGTSPRSASTPGPAPDSPSSASGRFSTSPLLSPCFPYHTALQHMSTLGFMGLGVSPSFLSAAAAAAAAASNIHPGTLPASYGFGVPLPQLLPGMPHHVLHNSLANSAILNRLPQPPLLPPLQLPAKPVPTGPANPATRSLSFSVDNILKPDFGPAPVSTISPTATADPPRRPTPHPTHSKSSSKTHSSTKAKHHHTNITENAISSLKRLAEFPKPESSASKVLHLDQNKASEAVIPRLQDSNTNGASENAHPTDSDTPKGNPKSTKTLHEEQHAPVDLSKTESTGAATDSSDSQAVEELPSDPAKLLEMNKWPAWIFCTRYSDRPSSGPRTRRLKRTKKPDEKRPRTAFTAEQLARLKTEFTENRYLTEKRRQDLARELQLHENQIKIWFQNKRAKIKKASGQKNPLALQLMAQGLYNHSTMAMDDDEEGEMDMEMEASSSSSNNAC